MKNPVYLFSGRHDSWDTIARKLRLASGIAIFLDYDGTLTPIRRTPSDALLTPEAENILQQMVQLPGVQVAIVTGRSMENIWKLVGVENIEFAANHGFHIYKNGAEWIHPQAISLIQVMSQLRSLLRSTFEGFPEVYIENKRFTLSIHYRNVAPENVRSLKSLVMKTVHSFNPTLQITRGKKVLEVRPQIAWGKGRAVLKMLNTNKPPYPRVVVFIGDDTTDEDVFQALRQKGITIRVGKSTSTHAQYYLKNIGEVMHVLRSIISLRRDLLPRRRLSAKP